MQTIKHANGVVGKVILAFSLISLIFTFTNLVPVSSIIVIFLIFIPFLMFSNKTHHFVFISVLVMFCYYIISVLIYHPDSLLNYQFYRRDGNVFITFAPLLILSATKIKVDLERVTNLYLYIVTSLNAVFLLVYFVTGGTIFIFEQGIYHFLFGAHNAAGGFLAVLTSLSIGYYFVTKKKIYLLMILINAVGLLETDSRGSILGIAAACIIVLFLKDRFTKTVVASIVILELVVLSWLFVNSNSSIYLTSELFSTDVLSLEAINRGGTIINRGFYLWPRAIYLFLQSPIFGTGFGSYNDVPYNLQGIGHLFQYNIPGNIVFADNHAHHTFLHVLAETGLVGLILLFFVLKYIKQFLNSHSSKKVGLSLELVYWVGIISSLTEHRLFTPSQMLPFTILLGLAISNSRYHSKLKETGENL